MTSHNLKPQNLQHSCPNEEKTGVTKKDGHEDHDGIRLIINRQFHKSLDLNYPMLESNLFEFGTLSRPPLEWQDFFHKEFLKSGVMRCDEKERNGRCFPIMSKQEKKTNLDLILRLSLPGLHPQDEPSNQVEISSSSSSQRSCMSIDMNSIDSTDMIEFEVASLVLMGCTYCLVYVMVSEVDPKCPQCKRTVLVDMFRQRPAKKPRKS